MHQARLVDHAHVALVQPQGRRQRPGIPGHILRVVEGVVVLGVDGRGDRVDRGGIGLPVRQRAGVLCAVRGIKPHIVLAALLHLEHAHVRKLQHLLRALRAAAVAVYPGAEGKPAQRGVVQRRQCRGDPARQGHPLRAAQLWHGCRKHLAAVPGQRRLLPRIPAQKACQLLKGPVALLLAVQLVVQLKIVQIQQQQGKRASRRPLVFQRRQKCPAVQKAGELVGARLPVKPAIQPCIFQPHRHHRPHRGQKHQIVVGVVPLGGRRAQKQDSLQAFIVLEGHNAPDAVPAHHAELILCNLHARPLHLGGPHTSLLRAEPGGAGVLRPNGLHLVFQPRRIRRQKLLPPLVQQKHAGGAFAVDLLHLPPHRVHQLLPRQVVRRGHAEPLQRQVSLPLF